VPRNYLLERLIASGLTARQFKANCILVSILGSALFLKLSLRSFAFEQSNSQIWFGIHS
jgi:hypothetical protein